MNDLLSFFFDLIRFFLATLLLFYLPGRIFLSYLKINTNFLKEFFYSIVSGILLFTLLTYFFSWINLTTLFLYIYSILLLFFLFKYKKKLLPFIGDLKQLTPFIIIGLIFSLIITTRGIWQNNFVYESDDIIHLAYITEFLYHFPPDNPGFSNVPLLGYHFFNDFLIAKVHQISNISIHRLYFQFFPLLVALLWTLGSYIIGTVRGGIKAGWWTVFLVMFGGSAAFLFHLFGYNQVSLNAGLGIDQPVTALLNGPYAISFVLILLFLISLFDYLSTSKTSYIWILMIVAGLTPMFKIYGGLLLYVGLGLLGIFIFFKKRWKHLVILTGSGILTALTFLLFSGEGNRLYYQPLWAPHAVLEFGLPWYGFHEKMYTYKQLSVLKGIVLVELHGLILFLLGNLGTRLIGIILFIYFIFRKRILLTFFDVILFSMTSVSILIPLFFIQSGKVFEIIQFGWYYPLFVSIFAGIGYAILFNGLKNLPLKFILLLLIAIMTLPSSYDSMKSLIFKSHFIAGNNELLTSPKFNIMKILAGMGTYDDTVLELPPVSTNHDEVSMISWFRSTQPLTPYFANKRNYFASQNIDFFNLNIPERAQLLSTILIKEKQFSLTETTSETADDLVNSIKINSIRYIITTDELNTLAKHPDVLLLYREDPYFLYQIY